MSDFISQAWTCFRFERRFPWKMFPEDSEDNNFILLRAPKKWTDFPGATPCYTILQSFGIYLCTESQVAEDLIFSFDLCRGTGTAQKWETWIHWNWSWSSFSAPWSLMFGSVPLELGYCLDHGFWIKHLHQQFRHLFGAMRQHLLCRTRKFCDTLGLTTSSAINRAVTTLQEASGKSCGTCCGVFLKEYASACFLEEFAVRRLKDMVTVKVNICLHWLTHHARLHVHCSKSLKRTSFPHNVQSVWVFRIFSWWGPYPGTKPTSQGVACQTPLFDSATTGGAACYTATGGTPQGQWQKPVDLHGFAAGSHAPKRLDLLDPLCLNVRCFFNRLAAWALFFGTFLCTFKHLLQETMAMIIALLPFFDLAKCRAASKSLLSMSRDSLWLRCRRISCPMEPTFLGGFKKYRTGRTAYDRISISNNWMNLKTWWMRKGLVSMKLLRFHFSKSH